MKINSIPNNHLYKSPKIQKTNRVVPKEVQKSGFGKNIKAASQKPVRETEKKDFSAEAEKILSQKEKVEIQAKFGNSFKEAMGYSRRGQVKPATAFPGQKLDLKG